MPNFPGPHEFDAGLSETMPEDQTERLLQLGMVVGRTVADVLTATVINHQPHQLAACKPKTELLLLPNAPARLELVAVLLPISLAEMVMTTAYNVIRERQVAALLAEKQGPSIGEQREMGVSDG